MHLQVVTPTGEVVSSDVTEVVIPGIQGEFGVLPGHIPFLSTVRPGQLSYLVGGRREHLAVTEGLAEVGGDDRVIVLVDRACSPDQVDRDAARDELTRLREELRSWRGPVSGSDESVGQFLELQRQIDWLEAQLSLDRSPLTSK